jgi:acyl-CoA synthetase (AMP-forming)/AMP-acid ligase II
MMFREYWGRPEATAAAFDAEGYFLTGDTVSLEGQPPYYKVSEGSARRSGVVMKAVRFQGQG